MSIEQTFEKWARAASQPQSGSMVSVFGLYSTFSEETKLEYFKLSGTVDLVPYDELLNTGIPAIMKEPLGVLPFILPANIGVAWIGKQQYSYNPSVIFLEFILHSAITPVISDDIFDRSKTGHIRDDIYDLVCDSGRWNTEKEAVNGIVDSISHKIYNLVQASSPVPLESLMTADLF